MTHIEIPYEPRPLQMSLHNEMQEKRWGVVVCHRRFGKTVWAINHLLRDALLSGKPNPRYAYMAPTYRQAKNVAWDYIKHFAGGIPNVKFHETELRCDLPTGARISLLGAENPDSLRGIYLDGCVMDEVSDMPENVFPEVLRPALSDRKGFCIFVGTPKGHNAFYDYYEQAAGSDEWLAAVYKASETGLLDEEELAAARQMMTNDQYMQEFECSWNANVPGAIYGADLEKIAEAGQITKVPYDPSAKVDDYYENRNQGLPHYCKILNERGYLYGTHNAPHDIEVRELGTGKSRRETAWDLGLNFRVVPKLPLEDGIHAAQMLIPRIWFDREKCKQLLECLRQYHRAYNDKNRTFRANPVHDWSSHAADAFRYFAVGLRESGPSYKAPQTQAVMDYDPFAA
jgi:hypothetical protein